MTSLADRLRGIVGTTNPQSPISNLQSPIPNPQSLLGGTWRDGCFVVDRRWNAGDRHGRETIGAVAAWLHRASEHACLFAAGLPPRLPFVFFDLETTGLSGGAGTQAFLIGCGRFEQDGGFTTRQWLLTRPADERPMLQAAAAELSGAGALVSFNGKSFDAPMLETRYAFHRLGWFGAAIAHVDVLHPARRFWKPADAECSLVALERRVLGVRRTGDVDGCEVPARYFRFIRTGDPRPLSAVLEHNRLDLLTLAALAARLFHLAAAGPSGARSAAEAFALGTVYTRADLDERARASFERAIEMSAAPAGAFDAVRIESLRWLALSLRRARRYEDAAGCWRRLLETRGCPKAVAREASQALAIHHEHRVRDLPAAKAFALRTLDPDVPPAWTSAVRHRLARIERKIEQTGSLKSEVRSRF